MQLGFALLAALPVARAAVLNRTAHKPLRRTVDLDRGESQLVDLADGTRARMKLLDVEEERDSVRPAIRQDRVKVEINPRAVPAQENGVTTRRRNPCPYKVPKTGLEPARGD
jgi:hypothetical protein